MANRQMEQDISSNSIESFENFGCLFLALNLRFHEVPIEKT